MENNSRNVRNLLEHKKSINQVDLMLARRKAFTLYASCEVPVIGHIQLGINGYGRYTVISGKQTWSWNDPDAAISKYFELIESNIPILFEKS